MIILINLCYVNVYKVLLILVIIVMEQVVANHAFILVLIVKVLELIVQVTSEINIFIIFQLIKNILFYRL